MSYGFPGVLLQCQARFGRSGGRTSSRICNKLPGGTVLQADPGTREGKRSPGGQAGLVFSTISCLDCDMKGAEWKNERRKVGRGGGEGRNAGRDTGTLGQGEVLKV